jgi:3-deoxy-D-manno-octulosonic-acid transferase
MYIVYSLLLALALLISMPWWTLQLVRLGKYRAGLKERLGRVPPRLERVTGPGSIWIHAVSVGEVMAVSRLVAELQKSAPGRQIFVSTTTATGQQLARERFGESRVFFMPLDLGLCIRPYLKALRPRMLLLAETEFWPNLLHMARKSGASVAIVNARISDRSFPRYRRFRRLFAGVLREVDLFLAQTEEDARRLREIGALTERVQVSGNLKFDVRNGAASPLAAQVRCAVDKDSQVLICGSTTEGEEELLLDAFRQVLGHSPSTLMVLAPRHPERFDKVAGLIASRGMTLMRRSLWDGKQSLSGRVFLLDSVGELASLYAAADVAFVGGSLLPGVGGHNILEPAQHGVPVVVGPNTANFREIVRIFENGGGIKTVTPGDLSPELLRLLGDGAERQRLGQRARELFQQNSGAVEHTLRALQPLLREAPGKR